jgi:uncharacterized membrane protein YeaQ/YmgE (transglycosylase-associated protein family)
MLIMPRYPQAMAGQIIAVVITAFFTGALARFAVPGPDPMPWWLTVLIGLIGTLAAWGVIVAIADGDPAWVGITGFLVSIGLVLGYRRFVQKRALWGPDAYRFPQRGIGVEEYRERLQRAGIDPESIGEQMAIALGQRQAAARGEPVPAAPSSSGEAADDPTENPAHYLRLLDELHDTGVLSDDEYTASRTRLLERLRA